MNRILFGDNQFFGINHMSEDKARNQSILFNDNSSIISTIDYAYYKGLNTFMCTTHDRMQAIAKIIKSDPIKYQNFSIYPCLPYAHKYANAITELGFLGTLKQYVPGNFLTSLFKGGAAYITKDYISMMQLLVDAEMKIFNGLNTPVIFLQNVITDLLLGLQLKEFVYAFHHYIISKYNAEPGYITMNMPKLIHFLEEAGIENPIICSSINIDGFRMSGGRDIYEKTLTERNFRVIAMQIFSGGASNPEKSIEYVCSLPNIESILFGASSKANINNTISLINKYDNLRSPLYIDNFANIKIY